jgi:hypothetical protein
MTTHRCTAALVTGQFEGIPLALRCERDQDHPEDLHLAHLRDGRPYQWTDTKTLTADDGDA